MLSNNIKINGGVINIGAQRRPTIKWHLSFRFRVRGSKIVVDVSTS